MRSRSLTRQLIWTLTLGAVVLWLLTAFLTASTLRARLDEAFDGGLRETAERLLPLAVDGFRSDLDEGSEVSEEHEVPMVDANADEYIVYQVRLANGTLLLRSHDAPRTPFPSELATGFSNSGPWRIFTIGTANEAVFIQVAEATAHRSESLTGSLITLLVPVALLVPLSALGIFFAVRRGLRPVRNFSRAVGERHATNLSPIGTTNLPSELQPMAQAVDALIARLRTALEAERAFAANSAHELRTPIAGSLAQTQRLIAELGDHPTRPRARQIEESLLRLRQLAETLLQLSRADAGMSHIAEPIDLMPAFRITVDDTSRSLPDPSRLEVDVAAAATLRARIDIDAFGIVLRNLLGNALLHGDSGQPVQVSIPKNNVIQISNGGPVVPPDRLEMLRERFVRGTSTAHGSGLGLAIVETIMAQIGGSLELLSPAPGRADGFCARLNLPNA